MSWADEMTLAFLRMYKDRPLLWDPTYPGYKNKNRRHDYLMELSRYFGLDKLQVEKKIRTLQSQFSRERKKEKHSLTTESGRDEPYVSKWFGYQSMLFLVDKHKAKRTYADIKVPKKQELIEEEEKQEVNEEEYHNNSDETETNKSDSPKNSRKRPRIIRRKQRPVTRMPIVNEAFSLMKSIHTKLDDKDEFTLFGEQVAVKLRKIPSPQARFAVQSIINKAFFDAEMGLYSNSDPSVSSPPLPVPVPVPVQLPAPASSSQSIVVIKSENENEFDDMMMSL